MDHARFWSLVDGARGAHGGTAAALSRALEALPAREIVEFDGWFWAYYLATRREDLWAAVYAIRGGCGDDSFDYFRGWLISRGEDAVLAAIRDPEALAELIGDANPRDELMLGAASDAHRRAHGGELPDDPRFRVAIPGRAEWPADRVAPGLKWDDAFYAAHFPKLYARYIEPVQRRKPTGAISAARFWEIIEGARDEAASAVDAVRRLERRLCELTLEELIGFHRWLSAYNHALFRDDLRAASAVLLGKNDVDTFAGFRGWLIVQGQAAVHAAVHELDSLLEHARHPPAACQRLLFVESLAANAHATYLGYLPEAECEAIPDRATWSPDWTAPAAAIGELRARLPRLSAGLSDVELASRWGGRERSSAG
jgi:hypothetical protein